MEVDLDVWQRVVREWAYVQRRLAEHTERLLGAGVSAMLPATAAGHVADRIDPYAALPAGEAGHLDADTAARLRALMPAFERWAERGKSWRRVLPYANAEELKEWGVTATWWLTGLLEDA